MKRSLSEYERGNLKKKSLIDVILENAVLHEIRDIKFPKVEISCIEVANSVWLSSLRTLED